MTATSDQLLQLLETLPVSIALIQRDFSLTYANQSFARILGREPRDVIGRTCSQLSLESSSWGDWSELVSKVFQTNSIHRQRVSRELNGRRQALQLLFSPYKDQAGQVELVVVLALLSEEFADLDDFLCGSPTAFTAFMDAMPLLAWLRDEEERYVYLNPAYQQVMQARPAEWYGKHVREMWPAATAERFLINDQKLIDSGQPIQVQEEGTTPLGEQKVWHNVKFTYLDANNRRFFGGVGLDITALKEADKAREKFERQHQQMQKYESLGVLAGGVAHDFNNILTAILGYATLCKLQIQGDAQPQLLEHLAEIEKSSLRAAELCHQMLAYTGRGLLVMRPEQINTMIELLPPVVAGHSSRTTIAVNLDLSPSVPPVLCDADQVRQALLNLLANAADSIGSGEGQITIRTRVEQLTSVDLEQMTLDRPIHPGSYLVVSISDTGDGIAAELLPRVFEPFFSTKFVGRGMGLCVVQGIMHAHSGCVTVSSRLGEGATFSLYFPLQESAPPAASPQVQPESPGNRSRILIVDDEKSIRILAAKILEAAGYQVAMAGGGREALELFQLEPASFDLVILDLTMPVMNGQEVYRRLRQIRPDVKIILISGYNETEVVNRLGKTNYGGFLSKPFRMQALLNLVQDQLGSPTSA